ncbi:DUF4271 domain-containing protein [Paludibacter sp. 221]|uniref:DUF4271 domain-containing protein n=1 Tax=Paludibacter sp. 221 TaxID=2302939 RepID=UPI0013D44DED|nr:DUF4271 domain-containing protein [Paludibacter sp. 221]NDV47310.1 DUF4271 domain-containing protein [Paludibacter sp. 221]
MPNDSTYLPNWDEITSPLDSLQQSCDSLQAYIPPFAGNSGIFSPSLPETENWVFLFLGGLFFLLVFSIRMYPGIIAEDLYSIFRVKERVTLYGNSEKKDSRVRILFVLLSFCIISLYAYSFCYEPSIGNEFTFIGYLPYLLATSCFFIAKSLINRLLCFVFFDYRTLDIARKSYYNLIIFFGVSIFPLLIISIYATPQITIIAHIGAAIVYILTLALIFLKIFQIFYSKKIDFFYILLYLCTLEILPVIALILMYLQKI